MDSNGLNLGRNAIKNGLPPHRLMLAPDCGLGFLPLQVFGSKSDCFEKLDSCPYSFLVKFDCFDWILQVAEAKLANMVEAAKQLSSAS